MKYDSGKLEMIVQLRGSMKRAALTRFKKLEADGATANPHLNVIQKYSSN